MVQMTNIVLTGNDGCQLIERPSRARSAFVVITQYHVTMRHVTRPTTAGG